MIEAAKLYILTPVWMTLTFKVTIAWEIKNFSVHLLGNFAVNLDEIQYVATTCWFIEADTCFVQVVFQGESYAGAIL